MNHTTRLFVTLGAISAALAVAAGAFGAHFLAEQVSAERVQSFSTGADYQMMHALALILVGILLRRYPLLSVRVAGWFFVAGTVLFCGSLYGLVLLDQPSLGLITPTGGIAFIAGWLILAWGAWTADFPGKYASGRPADGSSLPLQRGS